MTYLVAVGRDRVLGFGVVVTANVGALAGVGFDGGRRRTTGMGVRALTSLTRARLRACAPKDSQEDPDLAVVVRQIDAVLRV